MDSKTKEKIFWWNLKVSEVLEKLGTSERGLSQDQVLKRQKEFGFNQLHKKKPDGWIKIFGRQFASPLIYILLISSVIVLFLGEYIDAGIIIFVLIVNAIVGVIQEGKAQKTLLALKHLTKTKASVIRDGEERVILDKDLVPGDIIILREGDKVPADSRLITESNLKIDESTLTGESTTVSKDPEKTLDKEIQTSEQKNMIFKGTFSVSGTAKAVVVETGESTVIGTISKGLSKIDTVIPLKKNITHLSQLIAIAIVIFSIGIFGFGVAIGNSITEMFLMAVAVAVSVIPEGLPIVITLVLATGVYRMSKQNALVKRLQAVEALGRATVIAVDKTGTITRNELMVEFAYANKNEYQVFGEGYNSKGEIKKDGQIINPLDDQGIAFAGRIASLSADARVYFDDKKKKWVVSGDPTEAAILVFGQKVGYGKDELEKEFPLIRDIPVNSKTKFHGTIHNKDGNYLFTIAGAPETVLSACTKQYVDGEKVSLTDEDRKKIDKVIEEKTQKALRIIVVAVSEEVGEQVDENNLPEMTLVSILGMKDAVRPEAVEAIKIAKQNGVRVAMITGDYRGTAKAVAEEAGIFEEGDNVLEGKDLNSLDRKELLEKLSNTSVFARVTPEHKLSIVRAYKEKGETIAMTGDGVNDALSLVAADLGVAMGISGTEVTKEAGDIVLMDDNFKSIVSAIEEGRSIYNTIQKVLLYLFSTNLGELLVIVTALFLLMPLPLLPSQIIWLNLVTDGFLVLAMAMEPKERLTGRVVKTKHTKYIIDGFMMYRIIVMASVMTVGTLALFSYGSEISQVKGWTLAMTVLAVFQWVNVWNCRTKSRSIFNTNPFSNMYIIWATVIVVLLHLTVVYVPFMQKIFRTTGLSLFEWGLVIMVGLSIIVVEEIRKFIYRFAKGLGHHGNIEDIETKIA